jgi:SNF2 family DNA or RNA helicase
VRYQPKTKPFKHQSKATVAALRAKNYAVFFEPRLGKTKVALDYCGVMAMKRPGLKVLVLFPAIARETWERELELHFPHFAMVEDFNMEWSMVGDSDHITMFFLASREETMVRRKGEKVKQEQIEAWNPDVVVIDESHEYKRPGSRGAQDAWHMIRRLRKRRGESGLPYVLLLSGTPNPKGWRDLFAQFRLMDESIFGTSAADFDERYVVRHRVQEWKIVRYRRERELLRRVRAHSLAVSAEEAGLANKQFFARLSVELPADVREMYDQLAEEFVLEWEGGLITAKNAGVKRLRLLQLTGGFATDGQQFHRAKLERVKAYGKLLLDQGESVLVYSRFSPEVAAVHELLGSLGFRAHRVDGSTSSGDRRLALAALRRPPSEPTAISFQYQAGSRALELVGAAETIFYGPSDSWVDYWGALKRTQGPNQRRPCRYTHLICPGTVDVAAMRGLRNKEDFQAQMMRNPRRYLFGL